MGKFAKALLCALFAAYSCVGQQPAVRVYNVTDATAFPALTAPLGSSLMVFINGLFVSPGRDYVLTTSASAVSVRFTAGSLRNNYQITIVTLPACPVCPALQLATQ